MLNETIDLRPLTLAESSTVFPRRNGKKTPLLTIKRWIINGYRGIRLEGKKVGNQWYTTAAAIKKFELDCTAQVIGPTVQTVTLGAQADAAAAREELRQGGFYGAKRPRGGKQRSSRRTEAPRVDASPDAG